MAKLRADGRLAGRVDELQAVPAQTRSPRASTRPTPRTRRGRRTTPVTATSTSTSRPSTSTSGPRRSSGEYLTGRGLRILESGCGSGRWMAFFETLGHQAFGVDDSWGPLRLARAPRSRHAAGAQRTRSRTPYPDDTFDAAFSSYVAEHFEDGPEELFREIHRVLKPGGLLLRRRALQQHVPPLRREPGRCASSMRCGSCAARGSASRSSATPRRRWTASSAPPTSRSCEVEPDDFFLPWTKGLFVDLCDVGSFVHYEHKPPFEFGRAGRTSSGTIQSAGLWHSCARHLLRHAGAEVAARRRVTAARRPGTSACRAAGAGA